MIMSEATTRSPRRAANRARAWALNQTSRSEGAMKLVVVVAGVCVCVCVVNKGDTVYACTAPHGTLS